MPVPEPSCVSMHDFDSHKITNVQMPDTLSFIPLAVAEDILEHGVVRNENGQIRGIDTYKQYYIYKMGTIKREMKWYKEDAIPALLILNKTVITKTDTNMHNNENTEFKKQRVR